MARPVSIINPTTEAATSSSFATHFEGPSMQAAVVVVSTDGAALGANEAITLQYSSDQEATWKDVYIGGALQQLTSGNNVLPVMAPFLFRVTKPVTASAVGVTIIY